MAFRRRHTVLRCAALAALVGCAVPAVAEAQQLAEAKTAKAKAAAAAAPAPQKLDVAGAQSTLESAGKLLAAGKTEPAIAQLSTVISSGNLPAAVMARALHMRGGAYRQQQKPALAIADLTSALWLKGGLSDAERADATQQRAAAYGEAGLSEQGQAITSAAKTRHAKPAAETPQPAQSVGGLFAGLFGSSSASPPKDDAAKAQPVAPAAKAPPAPTWSAATKSAAASPQPVHQPAAPSIALAHTPQPPAAPAAAAAAGRILSRVALVRTQAQAQAVVAQLKQQYASAIGNHSTDIGQATFGNMGSFFEVSVGPFQSSAEAQALCAKLKGSGLDCVPVSR